MKKDRNTSGMFSCHQCIDLPGVMNLEPEENSSDISVDEKSAVGVPLVPRDVNFREFAGDINILPLAATGMEEDNQTPNHSLQKQR